MTKIKVLEKTIQLLMSELVKKGVLRNMEVSRINVFAKEEKNEEENVE